MSKRKNNMNLKPNICVFCQKEGTAIQMTKCNHCHVRCCKQNQYVDSIIGCILCKKHKQLVWKKDTETFLFHMCQFTFKHLIKVYTPEFACKFVTDHIDINHNIDDLFWLQGEPTLKKLTTLIMVYKLCKHLELDTKLLQSSILYCYNNIKKRLVIKEENIKTITNTITKNELTKVNFSNETTNQLQKQEEYIKYLQKEAEQNKISWEEANQLMWISCQNTRIR